MAPPDTTDGPPGPTDRRPGPPTPDGGSGPFSIEPAFSVVDRLLHIHEAPLRNLRRSLWWIRKTFFTKPRSVTPAYLVEMTKPEVVDLFGGRFFEPGWELSYHYRGEVLNLRRGEYVDGESYDWWQVHIRGYSHDPSGIELTAHYETDPTEHPDAHIDLYGLDIPHGMAVVRELLEDEGVDFVHLDPSDAVDDDAPSTTTDAA